MYKALHQRDDMIDYVKKARGRGRVSIEDKVGTSIQGHEDFIKKSKERFITATKNSTDKL